MAAKAPGFDEWMAELARLSPPKDDEGLTCREWAAKLGCSAAVANQRLKMAQEAGLLRRGARSHMRIDGRPCEIPVYRIEKKKAGRSR